MVMEGETGDLYTNSGCTMHDDYYEVRNRFGLEFVDDSGGTCCHGNEMQY